MEAALDAGARFGHRLRLLLGPDPAEESIGCDDRRQLPQHFAAQLLREPHQASSFLGRDQDAFRQPGAEDLVLDLQVFDLAGQLFLRGAGDHE
jgi:hypothetical protein